MAGVGCKEKQNFCADQFYTTEQKTMIEDTFNGFQGQHSVYKHQKSE